MNISKDGHRETILHPVIREIGGPGSPNQNDDEGDVTVTVDVQQLGSTTGGLTVQPTPPLAPTGCRVPTEEICGDPCPVGEIQCPPTGVCAPFGECEFPE